MYCLSLFLFIPSDISVGDVVGFRGTKVTRNTANSISVSVVAENPAIHCNVPTNRENHLPVVYLGHTPVKVQGSVKIDDKLIPSGNNDGFAIVKPPNSTEKAFATALADSSVIFQLEMLLTLKNGLVNCRIVLGFLDSLQPIKRTKVVKLTRMWYNSYRYSWLQVRNAIEGVITLDGEHLNYTSETVQLDIRRSDVSRILHTTMGGDVSSSWTCVEYCDESRNKKQAYFAQSTGGVWATLFGGGHDAFVCINDWHLDQLPLVQ
jgi:hypothetical protein